MPSRVSLKPSSRIGPNLVLLAFTWSQFAALDPAHLATKHKDFGNGPNSKALRYVSRTWLPRCSPSHLQLPLWHNRNDSRCCTCPLPDRCWMWGIVWALVLITEEHHVKCWPGPSCTLQHQNWGSFPRKSHLLIHEKTWWFRFLITWFQCHSLVLWSRSPVWAFRYLIQEEQKISKAWLSYSEYVLFPK